MRLNKLINVMDEINEIFDQMGDTTRVYICIDIENSPHFIYKGKTAKLWLKFDAGVNYKEFNELCKIEFGLRQKFYFKGYHYRIILCRDDDNRVDYDTTMQDMYLKRWQEKKSNTIES